MFARPAEVDSVLPANPEAPSSANADDSAACNWRAIARSGRFHSRSMEPLWSPAEATDGNRRQIG